MYIKNLKKINKKDIPVAGGKGAALGEMVHAGLPVPEGFVVLASAFHNFIKENRIEPEIDKRLLGISADDINSVNRMSRVVRDMIFDSPLSDELREELFVSFKSNDLDKVAVRSSATAEDSLVASWAGELQTFLNVNSKDLGEKIKECWASLYTPRAIMYRYLQKMTDQDVLVAVVVQKMVDSDCAGVAFTTHPISKNSNHILIETAWGQGEGVVSGKVTPDTYVVDKTTFEIISENISFQKKRFDIARSGLQEVKMAEVDGLKRSLAADSVRELAKLCQKVEGVFGQPSDIEWAKQGDNFYITQSRPITTL